LLSILFQSSFSASSQLDRLDLSGRSSRELIVKGRTKNRRCQACSDARVILDLFVRLTNDVDLSLDVLLLLVGADCRWHFHLLVWCQWHGCLSFWSHGDIYAIIWCSCEKTRVLNGRGVDQASCSPVDIICLYLLLLIQRLFHVRLFCLYKLFHDNLVFFDLFAAEGAEQGLALLLEVLNELLVASLVELVVLEAGQLRQLLSVVHALRAERAVLKVIPTQAVVYDCLRQSLAQSRRTPRLVLVFLLWATLLVLFLPTHGGLPPDEVKIAVELKLLHTDRVVLEVVELA